MALSGNCGSSLVRTYNIILKINCLLLACFKYRAFTLEGYVLFSVLPRRQWPYSPFL